MRMTTAVDDSPASSDEERKPIRPVERLPMKDWLLGLLNDKAVPTLTWSDKAMGEFRISWCHGSRQGWNPKHADLFSMYAKHTGRYHGYAKDPKKWKANFRCALNSLKDVMEVKEKSNKKGGNAFRIYRFCDTSPKETRSRTTRCTVNRTTRRSKRKVSQPHYSEVSSSSGDESQSSRSKNDSSSPPASTISQSSMTNLSQATPLNTISNTDDSSWATNINISCVTTTIPSPTVHSLPKFDAISPGLGRDIEFGKMHCIPRHNSGFTIMPGKCEVPTQSPMHCPYRGDLGEYTGRETPEASPTSNKMEEDITLYVEEIPSSEDSLTIVLGTKDQNYMDLSILTPPSCESLNQSMEV